MPVNGSVSATFSEAIASSSVTPQSFTLTPAGGSAVSATFTSTSTTITLRPAANLAYQTVHTARLTTAIADLAGNRLAAEYAWTFTTEQDPNTLPATIIGTRPINNAVNIAVDTTIEAEFSKGMDPATITTTTVQLTDSTDTEVPSSVAYTPATRTLTLTPDDSLDYSAQYTVTIGTGVLDTFGIALASAYSWQFFTEQDPETPVVSMTWPKNDAILDDTVTLQVDITAWAAIDSVVYYLGTNPIGTVTGAPYSLAWTVSGMAVGNPYALFARVYDAQGRMGASQTFTAYYQWVLVGSDINDSWPTDLRRVYARTTNDHLMLRVETSEPWNSYPYPKDTTILGVPYVLLDTTFAVAIYMDTDRNPLTGRRDGGGAQLNGIGADRRVVIGFFGGDTTLSYWDPPPDSVWQLIYDTTGLAYHSVPPDSNVFVIAMQWSDFGSSNGVDIVMVNAVLSINDPGGAFVPDFVPDLGTGVISIDRADRWIGDGFAKSPVDARNPKSVRPLRKLPVANPF